MVPQRPTPGNQALTHSSTAAGGADFRAAPEVAEPLAELLRHDVAGWQEHGLTRIKQRTVRRVFRGRLGDTPVHVKVFRADTIAARARDGLRGQGKGEREANHLLQARDAALPAVEPLAHGYAHEGGQPCSFVVTRSVAAVPFAFPCDDASAHAAGVLVRDVHDRGLQPGDLHPGNLLVGERGELWLCDLTSMQRVGELSMRRRAQGLALFCNPIDGGPLDPTTRAFLRGYLSRGAMPDGFRNELARATRQLRATALRSFGRRSSRSCRHTDAEPRRRGQPRWFWFVDDDGVDDPLREVLAGFDPAQHQPRRSGRRGAVWLRDAFAVKDRDAGKARKLWLAHYWLRFARVPTPTPLALRLHGGRGRVFVRRLPSDDLAAELRDGRLDDARIAACAYALGAAVGRLHGHGLRNRDLKFENLVRVDDGAALAMVDLDGVTLHGAEDTRGCGRDLGRLLAAWADSGHPGGDATVQRFIYAYVRIRRQLLQQPPVRRILAHAERRAGEWRKRHA
jgi:tRNA A-37 threonylcarbamoyl transferase component Bud32